MGRSNSAHFSGIYGGALLKKFNQDRLGKKAYCNVIINVCGVKYDGHKFLLGAVSGYFDNMFQSNFLERSSDEIVIRGPPGNEFTSEIMDE